MTAKKKPIKTYETKPIGRIMAWYYILAKHFRLRRSGPSSWDDILMLKAIETRYPARWEGGWWYWVGCRPPKWHRKKTRAARKLLKA